MGLEKTEEEKIGIPLLVDLVLFPNKFVLKLINYNIIHYNNNNSI